MQSFTILTTQEAYMHISIDEQRFLIYYCFMHCLHGSQKYYRDRSLKSPIRAELDRCLRGNFFDLEKG